MKKRQSIHKSHVPRQSEGCNPVAEQNRLTLHAGVLSLDDQLQEKAAQNW